MEKRTAIIFGGSAYNIKYSLPSLIENLIIPNNADVFVMTTRYCKRRKTPVSPIPEAYTNDEWVEKTSKAIFDFTPLQDSEVQFIKETLAGRLKNFRIAEEEPEYMDYLIKERRKMVDIADRYIAESVEMGVPAPFRGKPLEHHTNGNVRCVVDQYRHILAAYKDMEKYEQDMGFRYDYVMRARIDFICPKPIVIEQYLLNQDDQSYLYVMGSFRRDKWDWCDEWCWFCFRRISDKIFHGLSRMGHINDRKYNTRSEEQDNDFIFDPEIQFDLLLQELNMKVVNVRIYRSATYTYGGDYDYFSYFFRRDYPIDLEYEFSLVKNCESDINEHCQVLHDLAKECDVVVELGMRFGNSTTAILAAKPKKFVTYDLAYNPKMDYLKQMAEENGLDFEVRIESITQVEIPECDFLFIDTAHHADQTEIELKLHADKAKKYLVFHDVVTFWNVGESNQRGMREAIEPFMEANKDKWKVKARYENNNGLLVLERIG